MSLDNFVKGIMGFDGNLRSVTNDLAHKVNEWVGVGNYQLSSVFFSTAASLQASLIISTNYNEVTTPDHFIINPLPILLGALSIYHVVRNRSLERREKDQVTGAEAVSVDFNFLREKKSVFNLPLFRDIKAKVVYSLWLVVALAYAQANLSYPAHFIGWYSPMILGQYFREVDHLKPTKKNKVFDFFRNIIPKE